MSDYNFNLAEGVEVLFWLAVIGVISIVTAVTLGICVLLQHLKWIG